jgi:hypothetical protein
MRTSVKRAMGVGALATIAFAVWKAWGARARTAAGDGDWDNAPFPFPPVPRPAPARAAGDGTPTHQHVHIPPEIGFGGGPETERGGEVAVASIAAWIEPADGACPTSHPVKAKLASGIYHVPGGMNYDRTNADRCYLDTDAAERDGLRPAKM